MKLALKRLLLALAVLWPWSAHAEPVAVMVTVTATGFVVAGKEVATIEQLRQKIEAVQSKEVLVVLAADASMQRLSNLVSALQKQGMRVGLISSPANQ